MTRFHSLAAVASALLFFAPSVTTADDCNFNDGSPTFDWKRVMDCYHSVPFNHGDLENAVEFLLAARERTDLRENFEAQNGWRASTDALDDPGTENDYASDFAMQLAIVGNHKEFLNPHWRYRRPNCYTLFLAAFMPFDFGSDLMRSKQGKPEQVFFIEHAPFLPELYESHTGIDATRYIGMKIISINGVEPGEYFRQWGRDVFRMDANDGAHLNGVLQHGSYSLRISNTHDVPPRQASDTYVLESANGQAVTVNMPWVFAPRAAFGAYQLPPSYWPDNMAEFQQLCLEPSPVEFVFGGASVLDLSNQGDVHADSAAEFTRELWEKRELVRELHKAHGGARYFETPPGRRGQTLETIVPHTDAAEVKQLGDRATIIRLDHFVGDWKEEVIAGTDYACDNSDRLILDLRGNGGGLISHIEWLATHLLPDRTEKVDYGLLGRALASNVGRNELVERQSIVTDLYIPWTDCFFGYEAACFVDPATNLPLSGYNWLQVGGSVEVRGGVPTDLSRLFGFRNFDAKYAPGSDPIACPGKFEDNTLIILSDGTGASAAYFFPELIRDQALVVTAGGYVDETLVSGIARGGAVWSMNVWEAYDEQDLQTIFGPATEPLPYLRRHAETYIEQPGIYRKGTNQLHVDHIGVGDIHIDVWADSPASDGYVYNRVVNAVQKKGKK
jgi:hypothetical protein